MTVTDAPNRVSMAVGAKFLEYVDNYDITSDMMTPVDQVALEMPWARPVWDLVKCDQQAKIFIDQQPVFVGRVDERWKKTTKSAAIIRLNARDAMARVVDESAPLVTYAGLGIFDVAERIVGDLMRIETSNATNRQLITGAKGKTAGDPIFTGKVRIKKDGSTSTGSIPRKVQPGETRWAVLRSFLEEAGMLAWATADGGALVIGQPNYQQEAIYKFRVGGVGSKLEANVLEHEYMESTAERFAKIVAIGATPGASSGRYGSALTNRIGVSLDNPLTEDGTGIWFEAGKRLIVQDDAIRSNEDARVRAQQERDERDSSGRSLRIVTRNHHQTTKLGRVLYAYDTIANVVDEDLGTAEDWYITSCRYYGGKSQGGNWTELTCLPVGTKLRVV